MSTITIEPYAGGYMVIAATPTTTASEWVANWGRARTCAENLAEILTEQGDNVQIVEHQAA